MSTARAPALTVVGRRGRPGRQVAQAHGAVERLVAGQRGHGAGAGRGSRRGGACGARERPPTERVGEALPRGARFFPDVFFSRGRGRGRGRGAPGQWRPEPPRRPHGRPALIYVPYIKRVFRVPLWIFLREAFYIRSPPAAPPAATQPRTGPGRCLFQTLPAHLS